MKTSCRILRMSKLQENWYRPKIRYTEMICHLTSTSIYEPCDSQRLAKVILKQRRFKVAKDSFSDVRASFFAGQPQLTYILKNMWGKGKYPKKITAFREAINRKVISSKGSAFFIFQTANISNLSAKMKHQKKLWYDHFRLLGPKLCFLLFTTAFDTAKITVILVCYLQKSSSCDYGTH